MEEKFNCVICFVSSKSHFDVIQEGKHPFCVRSCGHSFCFPCTEELISRKAVCPLCRSKTEKKKPIPNYIATQLFYELNLLTLKNKKLKEKVVSLQFQCKKMSSKFIAGQRRKLEVEMENRKIHKLFTEKENELTSVYRSLRILKSRIGIADWFPRFLLSSSGSSEAIRKDVLVKFHDKSRCTGKRKFSLTEIQEEFNQTLEENAYLFIARRPKLFFEKYLKSSFPISFALAKNDKCFSIFCDLEERFVEVLERLKNLTFEDPSFPSVSFDDHDPKWNEEHFKNAKTWRNSVRITLFDSVAHLYENQPIEIGRTLEEFVSLPPLLESDNSVVTFSPFFMFQFEIPTIHLFVDFKFDSEKTESHLLHFHSSDCIQSLWAGKFSRSMNDMQFEVRGKTEGKMEEEKEEKEEKEISRTKEIWKIQLYNSTIKVVWKDYSSMILGKGSTFETLGWDKKKTELICFPGKILGEP